MPQPDPVTQTLAQIESTLGENARPHEMGRVLGTARLPDESTLSLVKLNGGMRTLERMDALYRHGFGDTFPFPLEMHRRAVERGVAIGAVDKKQNLAGMWTAFLDYRDCLPVDPPSIPEHARPAYLSHSVVHETWRNRGVGAAIAGAFKHIVDTAMPQGIRASVSPWNYPSVALFLKSGYRVVDFCRNLYGPGKHRFHVLYTPETQNTAYGMKGAILKQLAARTGTYTAVLLDSHNRSPAPMLETEINVRARNGVLLLRPHEAQQALPLPHETDAVLLCESSSHSGETVRN